MEELVTPKLVPLVIPKIGVGVEVTLINIITHDFEVFRTLDIALKDTHVDETPRFEPIFLVELVDITSEQLVDDLAIRVEHIVLSDKLRKRNLVFEGVMLTQFFNMYIITDCCQMVIGEVILS